MSEETKKESRIKNIRQYLLLLNLLYFFEKHVRPVLDNLPEDFFDDLKDKLDLARENQDD